MSNQNNYNDKIDFVMIWVDGGDIEWQKERNKYAGKNPEDLADYRFRDWDNLKYWFRAVEKYAPWVNNVYFVTNGQKPEWLNLECPKLKWVKHEEYIPKEYLPTFSANPIETNLFRIEGLSENFVFFNDDMFLNDDVLPTDFFKNGLPRYYPALTINLCKDELYAKMMFNNAQLINRKFKLRDSVKKYKKKWFSKKYGMKTLIKNLYLKNFIGISFIESLHVANPYLKSTFAEVWKQYEKELIETSSHKFRTSEDVTQYLFYWYDLLRGNFEPFDPSISKYYNLGVDDLSAVEDIINKKHKLICLNDVSNVTDFEKTKNTINSALDKTLPDKSFFEL